MSYNSNGRVVDDILIQSSFMTYDLRFTPWVFIALFMLKTLNSRPILESIGLWNLLPEGQNLPTH